MAKESNLWRWLHKNTKHVPLLDIRRVENLCEKGTPDVEGCLDGGHFNIELKSVARPAREATTVKPGVRIEQALWLRRRWRCGGNAWLLIQVGEGANRCVYLLPGELADRANEMTEGHLRHHSAILPDASADDIVHQASRRTALHKIGAVE